MSDDRELGFFYSLSRLDEEEGRQRDPLLQMTDLLYAAIPLRYPATLVEEVNRLLSPKGIVWQPEANIEWGDQGRDDFDHWQGINQDNEGDPFSLDEWNAVSEFAKLMKNRSQAKVLRLLADAMEQPETGGIPLADTPF